MNRRRFLQRSLLAASASVGLHRHARFSLAGSPPVVKSRPDVVLYEGTYPGWPWVAAGAGGTLYCVFREGTIHGYSAGGRAMLTRSTDRGRSWSPAAVVVDEPDVDDRNMAIVELPNRELLVVYNRYTADKQSQAMTTRSGDGGTRWSQPQPLDRPNTRTRSAPIRTSDGTLVLPYYIAPGSGSLAAVSKDAGRTWRSVRVPDTEGFLGDEWDVAEVVPGRLVGIFRNSHPQGDGTFWMSESRDGGRTWSVPRATNVRDRRSRSPANLVLQGKTPTIIYADRRMVSVSAVKSSDPRLVHWDLEHRLPCYRYNADQRPIADTGYPCSVPVGPHQRLIVDYEIRRRTKRITGYFVTFPDNW